MITLFWMLFSLVTFAIGYLYGHREGACYWRMRAGYADESIRWINKGDDYV